MINWYLGWWMILTAFVTGAVLGIGFHRDGFLGGYASFRRRILRLGHISLAALGMINVIYGYSPTPVEVAGARWIASLGFIVGGVAMPAVCFLTAWRVGFRHLFFVPVSALAIAAIQTLRVGPP